MFAQRLLFLSLILLGAEGAQAAASTDAMPFSDGVLWRVEGAGSTSYVFGTLHSTDEQVTTLPRPVSEAFAASQTLDRKSVV